MLQETRTLGWRPTCAHGGEPIPATILDPFSGAASTGVACMELGRTYVGIELSPEYVAMSEKRLRATQPGLVGL
jgi:DNA modification methylase